MVEHIVWLWSQGLALDVQDGRLLVSPRHRITEEARQRIQEHREGIVSTLMSGDIWRERRETYAALGREKAA